MIHRLPYSPAATHTVAGRRTMRSQGRNPSQNAPPASRSSHTLSSTVESLQEVIGASSRGTPRVRGALNGVAGPYGPKRLAYTSSSQPSGSMSGTRTADSRQN
ncbi:hypothetical protein GCM10010234_67140 [Streptomyces hawaiiensis]